MVTNALLTGGADETGKRQIQGALLRNAFAANILPRRDGRRARVPRIGGHWGRIGAMSCISGSPTMTCRPRMSDAMSASLGRQEARLLLPHLVQQPHGRRHRAPLDLTFNQAQFGEVITIIKKQMLQLG